MSPQLHRLEQELHRARPMQSYMVKKGARDRTREMARWELAMASVMYQKRELLVELTKVKAENVELGRLAWGTSVRARNMKVYGDLAMAIEM